MLFEAADQQPEIALERIISGLSALKNEPWNTYRVSGILQSKMFSNSWIILQSSSYFLDLPPMQIRQKRLDRISISNIITNHCSLLDDNFRAEIVFRTLFTQVLDFQLNVATDFAYFKKIPSHMNIVACSWIYNQLFDKTVGC